MKKLKLKFNPTDRGSIVSVTKSMGDGIIKSITITEGVFVFMRSTAVVEMNEENFDANLKVYKSRLNVMCSKRVVVKVIKI